MSAASISPNSQLIAASSVPSITVCFLKLWSRRGMASFRNASTKRRPYYKREINRSESKFKLLLKEPSQIQMR